MTRFNLISIVKPDSKQKVPILAIINLLFIVKVDLPKFPVNRHNRSALNQSITRNSSSNDTKITDTKITNQPPILDKHTNSMPSLSTNTSSLSTLSSVNHCLLHSLTHTIIIHQQQIRLSTQFFTQQLTFDCHSATNF